MVGASLTKLLHAEPSKTPGRVVGKLPAGQLPDAKHLVSERLTDREPVSIHPPAGRR